MAMYKKSITKEPKLFRRNRKERIHSSRKQEEDAQDILQKGKNPLDRGMCKSNNLFTFHSQICEKEEPKTRGEFHPHLHPNNGKCKNGQPKTRGEEEPTKAQESRRREQLSHISSSPSQASSVFPDSYVVGKAAMGDLIEPTTSAHFSGLLLEDLRSTISTFKDVQKQPFIIGVAGGTAAGKTTVCNMIVSQLHDQRVALVNQDLFYRVLNEEELKYVHDYNFDHPDSFDTEHLIDCMMTLKQWKSIDIPSYNYKLHQRCAPIRKVNPSDVIILEGILVFHDPQLRELMNMKIFVDTDADIRLARRIRRNTARGQDVGLVLERYTKFVKPAYDEFILPSKKYADIIIPRGGDNHVAIDLIVQHIRTKLGEHDLCKIYPNLYVVNSTFQIKGMHTLIRDIKTTKHDFVFYADRLIRLVVEHGLGHLSFTEKQVITPTGSVYIGVEFCKTLCGVSIIHSGESMENALRACCKGIEIGKILIREDGDNSQLLIHEKLPKDISNRHVLLLDPVLATGNSAMQAILLLLEKGVKESNIIFLNLISAPEGIHMICKMFPRLKIVTSEIDVAVDEAFQVVPGLGEFGDRYFGKEDDFQTAFFNIPHANGTHTPE